VTESKASPKVFVFAACNHLVKRVWKNKTNLVNDSYKAYTQLIDYCVANLTNVVLGGDVFDSTMPGPEDIRVFRNGMERLKAAGLTCFYYQGQHERRNPPWLSAICDDLVYVNETLFEPVPGLTCYALDQRKRDDVEEACSHIPLQAKVLMIHQLEKSLIPFETAWDFDPEWLPPQITTVIAGDLHQPTQFTYTRPDGVNVLGVYSGSQHALSVREDHDKSFLRVAYDVATDTLDIGRVGITSRAIVSRLVTAELSLDDVVASISKLEAMEPAEQPIWAVKFSASVEGAVSRLQLAAQNRCHLFLYPVITDNEGIEVVVDTSTDDRTRMVDYLPEYTEAGSHLHTFMYELLTSCPDDAVANLLTTMEIKQDAIKLS